MARLEEIVPGACVTGLAGSAPVSIVAVKWFDNAIEVTFKGANGQPANELLYRNDEGRLAIKEVGLPWSFDADAKLLRLVSEAYRIHLAHIFDPYLAVHASAIEPLPHQISAVYKEMLSRLPLRFVLADDPGAGKTIMAGLLMKELLARGDLRRCMIVAPGSLVEQWQDELLRKFGINFSILTNDQIESAATGNVFMEARHCIVRLDKMARNEDLQAKLKATDWDLIVCDEAHKMSATVNGNKVHYTKRFLLGRILSSISRHFLLLTATPHNGKEEDFAQFMSLVDPDRFEGAQRIAQAGVDVSGLMRRMVKEDLMKFDGTPLFPQRMAYTVNYDLSEPESELYDAVTGYVQGEFNRAQKLNNDKRKTTVGFALTVLQRRLASSPEAIYQSLRRRRERLVALLADQKAGKRREEPEFKLDDDYDDDDMPSGEMEETEEKVADQASAAQTIVELEAEIAALGQLERMANDVRHSGRDKKWEELSGLLQDDPLMTPNGHREKLIIFTEHRDTLHYLRDKIKSILLNKGAVVAMHGGMSRAERRGAEESFKHDKEVLVLVATDAAGEGINLQRAHLMVNYDLPWNPNRLEQRFGRIHRIGQKEVCHLWNLVAHQTREGMVFQRLFEKLENVREALQGKVYDVLGKVTFGNRPLRDLLIDAIRYGNDPKVREGLNQVVDSSLDIDEIQRLLDERALTNDAMDASQVRAIREEMERLEARKLQPNFIESFFIEALSAAGGKIRPRENGRFEITHVPSSIRGQHVQTGLPDPVLQRYERVCFDKRFCAPPGQVPAALLAPGHPLLEATIALVRERNNDLLKRGAIFIDDHDFGQDARLLFYIEAAVQDGTIAPNGGRRAISKRVHFVEIAQSGAAQNAGHAPYLDYRPAEDDEQAAVQSFLASQAWLASGVEDMALNYAISQIVPAHLSEVRQNKLALIEKTAKAVQERLSAESEHWHLRAAELKMKESVGIHNASLNSQIAAARADELDARLHRRLADLEAEKQISAALPIVVGGAIVIPVGLLDKLLGRPGLYSSDVAAKNEIERMAMNAVMEIETRLGYKPKDVSAENRGYDIESAVPPEKRGPNGNSLRFIEVKGRALGARTVTVTKNEILCALNVPDDYILAIVEVGSGSAKATYLKNLKESFGSLGFATASVNYGIADLVRGAEVVSIEE